MLLSVECPFCGRVLRVDPARVGEYVDCPSCRARLTVPDAVDEGRADDQFGFDAPQPGRKSLAPASRQYLTRVARMLAGVAIVAIIIGFVAVHHARNVQRAMPRPGRFARVWPRQRRVGNRQPGQPFVARNKPNIAGNFPAPAEEPEHVPNVSVGWNVLPDPPVDPAFVPPHQVVHILIPPGPNPEVLFPATPSTMVSVGNIGHGREFREIWDFRANRRIGTTRGLRTHSENLGGYYRPISALSADGRLFMTQGKDPFALAVWDVVAERLLGVVSPAHAPTAGMSYAAFASPEQILAGGFATPFQMLDVAGTSRKPMEFFPRQNEIDHRSLAVSPGGHFLAVFDKSQMLLRLFDIESGTPAGQLSPPFKQNVAMRCDCAAFSPNGRELAALLVCNNNSYLACWDVGSARLIDHIDFGGNLGAILGAPFAYLHTPLEWFPDGRRWLVHGQGIVDRRSGKLASTLRDEPGRWRYGLRHVIADDCVLSMAEEKGGFVLASLRLSPQNINRVRPPADRANSNGKQ